MSFAGKSAVITGGNGSIGFQTARNLLLQGVTQLAICDLNRSDEVLQKLQAESPTATIIFQKTDVTKRADVEASFKAIYDKFGYIDILINSAGIFDEYNFERAFAVNVFGLINATQVACQLMGKEYGGRGGIIGNIASTVGFDCIFAQPIYNATKHAVVGFARTLGDKYYYNVWGIKFMLLCPGVTTTPFISGIGEKLYHKDANPERLRLRAHFAEQSPEVCGHLLVDLLATKPNGTMWMLDGGKVKEIVLKNIWLPETY